MRIMIVDDSPVSREILREALAGFDAEVMECENGRRAIEEYVRFRPEVVLMDIQMPVIDGISATKAIRRSDPRARVIVVSQFDETDYRVAAALAGAERYFLKQDVVELLTYIQTTIHLN
jgi:CheY-like chemotaxis protein